jgi:hypothetical protein
MVESMKGKEKEIILLWDKYLVANRKVVDTKGYEIEDIDARRLPAISAIKSIISDFLIGAIDVAEFKTRNDSYNKKNNFWGFTAVKGQMFFNLLVKASDASGRTTELSSLLRKTISLPGNLQEGLGKINDLKLFVSSLFENAIDKRKAPNPGSVGYFLSYFWQIQDHKSWPIIYSSMILSFEELGFWEQPASQSESYREFYLINEEIKRIISNFTKTEITNWDVEHCFWNHKTVSVSIQKPTLRGSEIVVANVEEYPPATVLLNASFNIYEYVPGVVADLISQGKDTESSSSAKGSRFEKSVGLIFRLLGFQVDQLGQGSGREPDLIAINRKENIAFIVDAKAYANGYSLSTGDERAIREYIRHHCVRLRQIGIQRIGFILVSNSFKSDMSELGSELTWNTDIKRFVLLESEGLLHLLAYHLKDQRSTEEIVDAIVGIGSPIRAHDVVEMFDDV